MKNKTNRTLDEIIAEIQSQEGLPENIVTEAQLWDEIFKKLAYAIPASFLPLIEEVHKKVYPKDVSITPLETEYSIERSDTKEITSIRADVAMLIADEDIFHFECEIKFDGSMTLRMFEYDVHIALSYSKLKGHPLNGVKPDTDNPDVSRTHLYFPNSSVLYLQDSGKIPKELVCTIHFPDGGTYDYHVPTIKVQSYTLSDIQNKHLTLLIPFLPLRFRKLLNSKNSSFESIREELTSFYDSLILMMNKEVENGSLTEYQRNTIHSLLIKSLIRVFNVNKPLLTEVLAMTKPILKLESEIYQEEYDAMVAEKDAVLAEKLAEKDAIILKLQQQLAELEGKNDN